MQGDSGQEVGDITAVPSIDVPTPAMISAQVHAAGCGRLTTQLSFAGVIRFLDVSWLPVIAMLVVHVNGRSHFAGQTTLDSGRPVTVQKAICEFLIDRRAAPGLRIQ